MKMLYLFLYGLSVVGVGVSFRLAAVTNNIFMTVVGALFIYAASVLYHNYQKE